MTDLTALDTANQALQASPTVAKATKDFGAAATAVLHTMNPAPTPVPTPTGGPGFWDATKGTPDPNSTAKIQNMLATAGDKYFSAGIARAYAIASTVAYPVPTKEQTASVAAPIPPNAQVGHTLDGLLIVYGPMPSSAHEQSVAAFMNDEIDIAAFEAREAQRLSSERAVEDFALGVVSDAALTKYSFSKAVAAGGKITGCFGANVMAPGSFTEPRPNSTSAGRLPLGFITPEDVANDVMAAMCFSTKNTGSAPAVYPADTSYPGSGTGLPYGSWIRLPAMTLDPALTKFENYLCRRYQACGAFLRDVGSTFMLYGSDQVNQGGQAHDWAAVGVTLEVTNNGYPYAHKFSATYVGMMGHLQLLLPPAK
jgi:hypothetical protein